MVAHCVCRFVISTHASCAGVVIKGVLRTVLAVDANLVVVDVMHPPNVAVGDEVVLLGCDTTNTAACVFPSLSTRIPAHFPRVFTGVQV
ncbi:hypothetical protein T484DRAFT_1869750 [Baffinella frigidus]|nr:hypothetical protein T484DRAFT_1869750 [Cryptophyta sp. CCMP2293]